MKQITDLQSILLEKDSVVLSKRAVLSPYNHLFFTSNGMKKESVYNKDPDGGFLRHPNKVLVEADNMLIFGDEKTYLYEQRANPGSRELPIFDEKMSRSILSLHQLDFDLLLL